MLSKSNILGTIQGLAGSGGIDQITSGLSDTNAGNPSGLGGILNNLIGSLNRCTQDLKGCGDTQLAEKVEAEVTALSGIQDRIRNNPASAMLEIGALRGIKERLLGCTKE
jgi:ABC-type transporter Mla subunit MlaD